MKREDIASCYMKDKERLANLAPMLALNTVTFLEFDLDSLWNQYQAGRGSKNKFAKLLTTYGLILRFFELRTEAGLSTDLVWITTAEVKSFLAELAEKSRENTGGKRLTTMQKHYRRALNGLFQRALEHQQIGINPITPLYIHSGLLEPHWTSQNLEDYQNFEVYLKKHKKKFSKTTIERQVKGFRILLYDAEQWHATNPDWPLELDGLFSDAKWMYEWLNDTTNRSPSAQNSNVTVGTTKIKLALVKRLFYFLKSQGRCQDPDFLRHLAELLEDEEGNRDLPGINLRVRGRISEEERKRVYALIEEYTQTHLVLGLRDKAIFEAGISAAMRSESLHDMRIENIRLVDDHWMCDVKVKRLHTRGENNQRIQPDGSARNDWYVSPLAYEAIEAYLTATGRDWNSTGPIWLSEDGTPLTLRGLRWIIRKWLHRAGCKHKNSHALRHIGCSQLLNEKGLSPNEVQEISQHYLASTLFNTYGRADQRAAFSRADKAYPMKGMSGEPEDIDCATLIKRLAMELNDLAAKIFQHEHNGYSFRSEHVQQLHQKFTEWVQKAEEYLRAHPPKNSPGRKPRPIA